MQTVSFRTPAITKSILDIHDIAFGYLFPEETSFFSQQFIQNLFLTSRNLY